MPSLVVANAGQLRLIWAWSGQLYALNVLGVVNSGSVAITQALANSVGAAIKTGFTSSGYAGSASTTVSLANVGIRDLRTEGQPEFVDSGAAVDGTAAGGILPPQTALCITLRTARVGQSYRGRVYLPGYDESVNTLGVLQGTGGGVGFVTAIQAALVAASLNLGVLSRPGTLVSGPSVGFITPVTSIVLRDAVWDTQRRRAIPGI